MFAQSLLYSYKKYGKSITNFKYARLPYGPCIDNRNKLYIEPANLINSAKVAAKIEICINSNSYIIS